MDGLYFYWFGWAFWIIVTFIMPKNNYRTVIAIWILLTISTSNIYLGIGFFDISIAYLTTLIGGFALLSTLKQKGLQIFSAITIMIGYSSLLIWEVNAPVWIFMPRLFIMPVVCVLLVSIIASKFENRLANSIIGICGGELLYCLLLSNYSFTKAIGNLMFLDTLSIIIFLVVIIEAIQVGKKRTLIFFLKKSNSN
ncbi:YphA family membrane protein [Ornithinibacillus californiensis]|uniref:YphA family membrane protein n=1 Tax=Ornithinibacillus californiensis TaxID=161536 RepID=UPI00064DE3EE|nr:hypothetical protein [Ornithinibacillus californiensis]